MMKAHTPYHQLLLPSNDYNPPSIQMQACLQDKTSPLTVNCKQSNRIWTGLSNAEQTISDTAIFVRIQGHAYSSDKFI